MIGSLFAGMSSFICLTELKTNQKTVVSSKQNGARIGILAADPGAIYEFYTMISMIVELLMWATRKGGVVKS